MSKRLSDKVAVITGAASGIGAATARLFAQEGARVVIGDIRGDVAEQTAADIRSRKGKALAVQVDVTVPEQVRAMIAMAVDHYGGLHILHSNAGVASSGTVETLLLDEWQHVLAVNLTGLFLCAKFAIPEIRRSGGGSVIATSSSTGVAPEKDIAAYAASKGGLIILVKQMALDYARDGIRVNCVCPGWIDTPFNDPFIPDPQTHQATIDAMVPEGRQGTPEEVARAALFLASEDSSYITGHVLNIDGGLTVP